MTMNELLEGIKEGAAYAGEFAAKTAVSAGKKASEVFNTSKYNLMIFDLKNDISALLKEIGALIYKTHKSGDDTAELIEEKLAIIDEKNERITELKALIDEIKDTKSCPACGAKSEKSAEFCKKCGTKL